MLDQNPFPEERKKREERRQAPEPKKREGRQAPEPQPEPGRTSKSWWNRTPFLRKEERRRETSTGTKEERRRETSTGTPAGTKRNQQIMMEQNPFPEERKKREEGRQAPEPQPEPGRTSKSWWNRTPYLRKERREKNTNVWETNVWECPSSKRRRWPFCWSDSLMPQTLKNWTLFWIRRFFALRVSNASDAYSNVFRTTSNYKYSTNYSIFWVFGILRILTGEISVQAQHNVPGKSSRNRLEKDKRHMRHPQHAHKNSAHWHDGIVDTDWYWLILMAYIGLVGAVDCDCRSVAFSASSENGLSRSQWVVISNKAQLLFIPFSQPVPAEMKQHELEKLTILKTILCIYIYKYEHMYTTLRVHVYLHYITLHHITLHCIALHCIALHCIALHVITFHCVTLHYIAVHCIALHCIALHVITFHCVTLHYIAVHYIALHLHLHCVSCHYISLRYIAVRCSAFHCIALHCIALHMILDLMILHYLLSYPIIFSSAIF